MEVEQLNGEAELIALTRLQPFLLSSLTPSPPLRP
jgi:hypothetical protein